MLRNIRLLYIHNFLSDFFPQWPYLVIYFEPIAGSYTAAMAVLAIETMTSALMDIPTGILSDRIGRRLTFALASFCAALGTGLYASAHGMALLCAGAFFTGLAQCMFSGNNNALLYETLKSAGMENKFHHFRASTGSMYQLGLCLSAFLAIFLSGLGLRFIFWIAVVPQVLGIFVSLFFTEPRVHVAKQKNLHILKQAWLSIYRNPKLILLMIGKGLCYGSGEAGFKFKSAYVSLLWPIWAVGLYRGLNHMASFCGYRLAGTIVDKIRPAYIFVVRDAYWFVTQTLALIINNFVSPILMLSGGLVFGPGEVASDHLMQIEFTDEQRATMGSLSSFVGSIVFAAVAIGIGVISDAYGVREGVFLAVAVGFLSLPIYAWLFRKDF